MKKLLLLLLLPVMLLAGCGNAETQNERFVEVVADKEGGSFQEVYVDKETRVMYLFVKAGSGGGLTVMLNPDGTPMLWQGEL